MLHWYPATFGPSGLGAYTIKRATAANGAEAITVCTITEADLNYKYGGNSSYNQIKWVDPIPIEKVGGSYWYWLQAVSGAGLSAPEPKAFSKDGFPSIFEAVTVDTAPDAPAWVDVKAGVGHFLVSWQASTSLDLWTYELQFTADRTAGTPTWIALESTDGSAYMHAGSYFSAALATVQKYGYRVRALDKAGHYSAWAASGVPNTSDYAPQSGQLPQNPTSVTLSASVDGSMNVLISGPTDPIRVGWRVVRYKSTASDGSGAVIDSENSIPALSTSTSFVDAGLDPKLYFNYRIYAITTVGNLSAGLCNGEQLDSASGSSCSSDREREVLRCGAERFKTLDVGCSEGTSVYCADLAHGWRCCLGC
ncbi:MAG: hypothetical protein MZW92_31400 [Comamonadaceae bacterium]|nr:hypothetical protein [Comamonadaceae bacterium]